MPGLYLDPTTDSGAFDVVVFNDTLVTPGRCRVEGWHRPVEYDHKKGKGTAGAEQTLKGLPPARGKITFWTWTPEQRAAWDPILDALRFDPTKLTAAASASSASSSSSSSATTTTSSVPTGQVTGIPSAGQAVSSFTGNTPNTTSTASQPSPLSSAFAISIFYPTLADIDVHFVLPPEKLGAWEPDGDDFSYMKREIEFVEYTGQPPNKSIAATPTGAVDAASATPSPGASPAAGAPSEGSAATNAAAQSGGVGADAQGAWGAS